MALSVEELRQKYSSPIQTESSSTGWSSEDRANLVAELRLSSQAKNKKVEEKGSKVGGFLKGVGKSLLQTTVRAGTMLAAPPTSVRGQIKDILFEKEVIPKKVETPLGDVKLKGETPKEEIGLLLQDVANVYGGGGTGAALKQGFGGLLGQAVKTGATTGLVSGSTMAGGAALEEDKNADEVLLQAGAGGLLGAGVGALTGIAGTLVGKFLGRTPSKQFQNVDDVIDEADLITKSDIQDASASLLSKAQKEAPKISIREQWAGIQPDIKKRIAGKQDKLKTYFNIAHARNLDDTIPTPLEFAAKRTEGVRDKLVSLLDDTGSDLGKFRQKISTYKVPIDDITNVENTFNAELGKMNIQNVNGVVQQIKGKVQKLSDSEIKVLQDLYDNLVVLKQSPNVASVIDNRIAFDNKINFAKQSREASNVIDPISRRIRSLLAKINEKQVGKLEAKTIQEYSNVIEAINELNSYVDRKAGAEFLLKRVLSERGGQTRGILEAIKKYTGVDLMDDATMAQIATDLIGNERQKGLFRQELTKSGLDINAFLRGDKLGAIQSMLQYGKGKIAEPEKMFLRASEKKPVNR